MALPPPDAGSTCLVTGASSGIGAELARQLAARGHGVTLAARREERLAELAAEVRDSHGVRVETIACDVADEAARGRMVAQTAEAGLAVEVLVNNAGFGSAGRFDTLDPEGEVRMVRTNVEAVVALCAEYAPRMVSRGRGAILNVASTAGFQPLPRQATYAATKAFVIAFTDALHTELKGEGVAATALCPGPVKTEFQEVAGIDAASDLPVGWMTAEDTARAALRGLEKGRRVVTPGPLNTATAVFGQHTPRGVLLALADRFYPVGK